MSERFEKLIVELMKTGDFSTISGFLDYSGYPQIEDQNMQKIK
jgi:hypothetical protein